MKEMYFKYGVEGGGETLYRATDGSTIAFYTEGSSGGMEPDEPVNTWKINYESFEDFWGKFIKNEHWFLFYPIFIHADAKEIVRKELEEVKQTDAYKSYQKQAWERILT